MRGLNERGPRARKWAVALLAAAVSGLVTSAVVRADLISPPTDDADLPQITAVPANQQASFGVLRRAQRAGEALSASAGFVYGANLALSRAVSTPAGEVRVVPANGHVCLRTQDKVSSSWVCPATSTAAADGVVMTLRSEDMSLLAAYAAVPDGATDVAFSGASGTHSAKVVDNVVGDAASDDTTLSFVDAAGTRHVTPLP